MLRIENIKPTWKHNIINQNSVKVNFYVGGRAVEFGQRAIYWSQTCVRVCGMFFLLSQIVLPLRCIPNEIPQISCRAFIWNFPEFQTSFYILFQYCSFFAIITGASGQFISDCPTHVLFWLLTGKNSGWSSFLNGRRRRSLLALLFKTAGWTTSSLPSRFEIVLSFLLIRSLANIKGVI